MLIKLWFLSAALSSFRLLVHSWWGPRGGKLELSREGERQVGSGLTNGGNMKKLESETDPLIKWVKNVKSNQTQKLKGWTKPLTTTNHQVRLKSKHRLRTETHLIYITQMSTQILNHGVNSR